MGLAKDRMMQEEEQGWHFVPVDRFVCGGCFHDSAIKRFIEENAVEKRCYYCKRRSKEPMAASMNSVLEIIGDGIRYEYGDPNEEGIPVEGGEYVFKVMTAYDLFDQIGWPTDNEDVQDEILQAFSDGAWVQKNFYSLPEDDLLRYGWRDFVELVKHKTRYFFTNNRRLNRRLPSDSIPPAKMLNHIGSIINETDLVREIKAGAHWYRARVHKLSERHTSAAGLGTVPKDKAFYSNRMSPAGIPMFYGASDEATAIAETYTHKPGQQAAVTVGELEAARNMWVVDLTDLPDVPNLFDETKRHLRSGISFLHDFVYDLTKPIKKDGREHIEYVPTQIVTEYIRRAFSPNIRKKIRGILYRSSQNGEGRCCVLFFRNEHCCDAGPNWGSDTKKWLGLVNTTRKEFK